MPDTVLWLRRDLRLHDHPALHAAAGAADGGRVLPLFVLDDRLWGPSGDTRRVWLTRSLRALHAATDGALVVRRGDPAAVLPEVVREPRRRVGARHGGRRAVRPAARRGRRHRARRGAAGPHRHAVRRRPGHGDQG
ncbi:hypothetical protein GCM10025868_16040 [Angustibacter aerolatus]|uniref:Photolyase/cryptochrome alpha/beta domain-containing protein n=1 Tax=Angustibacter aerolatus TaxID=1162965 RepID=A0ABQ6JEX0_9ACTN|nr:hypothetical protein GCM10025868_16040 [Angustibacter aerolatus]